MRYNGLSNNMMMRRRVTPSDVLMGGVFDDNEVNSIDNYCSNLDLIEAKVANNDSGIDKDVRESKIKFVLKDPDNEWMFNKFNRLICNINEEFYGFDLYGYNHFQYTIYEGEKQGQYNFHSDLLYGDDIGESLHTSITRKMTVVMLLSEPEKDFTGGEFQINVGREDDAYSLNMKRGDIVLFPSFVLHRVKPVLSGVRKSLVIWVEGPKFR